jgi:hypothetical protein
MAVMSSPIRGRTSRAETIAQDLITLLEERGTGDYIGESISQLEHSLQCAHYAKQAGSYPLRILCYDIDKVLFCIQSDSFELVREAGRDCNCGPAA